MGMVRLPAAEWMPDMPSLDNPGVNTVLNVIPRTPESYGPFSSLSAFSTSALDGPCLGAIGVQDTVLNTYVFAGTSDKIYQLNGGATTWTDTSIGGGYTTASGEFWRFAQFKNNLLATNYTQGIQSFLLNSGATQFSLLSSAAPNARYIAIIKAFCMVGNTVDGVGGTLPMRVWWSAENDPTNWPTPGSASAQQYSSDYNDLVGPQGQITGLVGNLGNADGAIFFERGIYRVLFVGPPDVFDFYPAEGVRGCRAPQSIVQLGAVVYYLGEDGFYVFDGATSQPIGVNKVDKWFFATVNQSYLANIVGAADAINKVIFWLFPSNASTLGVPDTVLLYNWALGRWAMTSMSAQWVFRMMSFGTALDNFPSIGYSNLDTVPFSLDSRIWQGGQLLLGAIDTTGHLAFFNGANLAATVGTSEIEPAKGQRAWINTSRPLVDGGAPTVQLLSRQRLIDAPVAGNAVTMDAYGNCPQRLDSRYVQALVNVAAGATWTNAQGVDLSVQAAGMAR